MISLDCSFLIPQRKLILHDRNNRLTKTKEASLRNNLYQQKPIIRFAVLLCQHTSNDGGNIQQRCMESRNDDTWLSHALSPMTNCPVRINKISLTLEWIVQHRVMALHEYSICSRYAKGQERQWLISKERLDRTVKEGLVCDPLEYSEIQVAPSRKQTIANERCVGRRFCSQHDVIRLIMLTLFLLHILGYAFCALWLKRCHESSYCSRNIFKFILLAL